MKVLHIEAGKHLYGGAKQVTYLIDELAQLKVKNLLVCTQGSEIATQQLANCDILPIAMSGEADVGTFARLRKLLKQHKPDLVHVHSRRGADIWGLLAAKSCGIPVVCSRRVDNPEPSWLARLKYHSYDKVITISEGIRQVLLAESVNPEQVVTVRSAVDTQTYQPTPDRAWMQGQFDLANDDLVVANFAQMIARKGQPLLIQAIQQLLPTYPNLKLLLFGQGPKLTEYKNLVAERGLANVIRFPGFRNDVARILPNVDIIAHPAYTEGLGVALLQASASSVPIVATAVGGIPEVVEQGKNGFLIETGDHGALAARLAELLQDKGLRHRFGSFGRQKMLDDFSTAAMAKGNLAVYKEVLAGS